MALSKEELAEMALLESEAAGELAAEREEAERMHLEALRLRKKLSGSLGKHGADFAVVETKIGVFALRKPSDVEIDTVLEAGDSRAGGEEFISKLIVHPAAASVQALFPKHPGLVGALAPVALGLAKITREAEAKK